MTLNSVSSEPAAGQYRGCCRWRPLQLRARSRQAAAGAAARKSLRTNLCRRELAQLWQFYIQLVEAAFKNLKHDLQLRPIYHQLEQRIERTSSSPSSPTLHLVSPHGPARQVGRRTDARRALPHYRPPQLGLEPLYRAQRRPKAPGGAAQSQPASPAAAAPDRGGTARSCPAPRRVVETYLDFARYFLSRESWAGASSAAVLSLTRSPVSLGEGSQGVGFPGGSSTPGNAGADRRVAFGTPLNDP